MLKKSSSQEPLGQFQPNFTGNMVGEWEFRFVQIKELPSFGQSKERGEVRKILINLQKSSSHEPLGQFQPNLAGNMVGGWEFRFVQIKELAPFGAQ